jgi:hypothetical protein
VNDIIRMFLCIEKTMISGNFRLLSESYKRVLKFVKGEREKLEKEYKEYQKELKKEIEEKCGENQKDFTENLWQLEGVYEEGFDIAKTLEEGVNNSNVLSVYRHIEIHLNNICRHIDKNHDPRSYVCGAIKCIKDNGYMIDKNDIDFLDAIRIIRNTLEHENGRLT